MHASLFDLYEHAGRVGARRQLGLALVFDPSPDAGRAARGADEAFRELVRRGFLQETGESLEARLVPSRSALIAARRDLMGCDPVLVSLLQRAGARWAAFASTAAKNLDITPTSGGEIVASGAAWRHARPGLR